MNIILKKLLLDKLIDAVSGRNRRKRRERRLKRRLAVMEAVLRDNIRHYMIPGGVESEQARKAHENMIFTNLLKAEADKYDTAR